MSERHRRWGCACLATDIDFVLLEYDQTAEPKAIVEYKHERAPEQRASQINFRALAKLGTKADIPVFACRYADDFSWFRVVSLNPQATEWVTTRTEMTEPEYVTFLYRLRGYDDAPTDVLESLAVTV